MVPVEDGGAVRSLWLEVKVWWFLYGKQGYASQPKTSTWPLTDWEKLQPAIKATPGDHRAVMLVRVWNNEKTGHGESAKNQADRWLHDLHSKLTERGASSVASTSLRDFVYRSFDPTVTTSGDVWLWSSTQRAE